MSKETEPALSPEASASAYSRLTWSWLHPLLVTAAQRPVRLEDLYTLPAEESAAVATDRLAKGWAAEVAAADRVRRSRAAAQQAGASCAVQPRVWRAFAREFGLDWLHSGLPLKTAWLGFVLVQVYAVRGLVRAVAAPGGVPPGAAVGWVVMTCVGVEGQSLCQHHLFKASQRLGMQLRTAVCGLVYRKLLALRAADLAAGGISSGALNNLLLSDSRRIEEACAFSHFAWHAAVELFLIFALAVYTAGLPALAGAGVIVSCVLLSQRLARAVGERRRIGISLTDARVRLTKEVLTAARAVKLNGWVPPLARRLAAARAAEAAPLRAAAQLRAAASILRDIPSPMAALATFAALAALNQGVLPAEHVFTVLALFNAVIRIMAIAPMGLQALAESLSGVARLQRLLLLPDGLPPAAVAPAAVPGPCWADAQDTKAYPVQLRGSFSWSMEQQAGELRPATELAAADVDAEANHAAAASFSAEDDSPTGGWLRDLDVRCAAGTLTAVVGPVGCGKSSLLLALLGELHGARGPSNSPPSVVLAGATAYCPQEAWTLNATLRANLLLRRPYDAARYAAVVAAAALEPDLAALPAGDATEVGERGVTLSGGQKARLGLARAAYGRADVFLLDDPLAAVDAATAAHLMRCLIAGPAAVLEGTTRLLVTNGPQWLPGCDAVLLLHGGRVRYHGPPGPLLAVQAGPPKPLGAASEPAPAAAAMPGLGAAAALLRQSLDGEEAKRTAPERAVALVVVEDRSEGAVTGATYAAFAQAAGGWPTLVAVSAAYVAQGLAYVATYLWLAWWSDNTYSLSLSASIGGYAAITGAAAVLSAARARILTAAMLRAASSLHDTVLERVLRAPVAFFDANPVGRILNRFAKDQATLDSELPVAMQASGELMFSALAGAAVVCAILPWFTLVLPPLLLVARALRGTYAALGREVKRVEGITRSPVLSHFGVTVAGLPCVRAFAVQEAFERDFHIHLDANNRAHWAFVSASRWLGTRLDALAAFAAAAAAACVAGARTGPSAAALPPGLAGMALVLSLTFAGTMQYAVRQLSELENAMTCVERLLSYAGLESEAAPTTPPGVLPGVWPSKGAVSVRNLVLRYTPDAPPTLNNLSFDVAAGHKVGLLGRTGAGKSTLAAALFRLVENKGCSGVIRVDGIDISRVGLDDLRQALSLIPQDPVLFAGTLGSNLDPFNAAQPAATAALLPRLGLARRAGTAGLDAPVSEGGDDWSLGERQLICLGRALLRRSRLLVCDEATASVDAAADARITAAIAADFAESTVLTIAHRLSSVAGGDRVVVLAPGGTLLEEGEPYELLTDAPGGAFAAMVGATGAEHAAALMAQAQQAWEGRRA